MARSSAMVYPGAAQPSIPRQAGLRTLRSPSSVQRLAASPAPFPAMRLSSEGEAFHEVADLGMPSRGGAGGPLALPPAAWLFGPPGVDWSNPGFTDSRGGGPNSVLGKFRVYLCPE